MKPKLFTAVAAVALGMAGAANAQDNVIASSDLDVRAGPGRDYPVLGVLGIDREATLRGCETTSSWCEISSGSLAGWVDSQYLVAEDGGDVFINEGPVDGVVSGSIDRSFVEPDATVITYIERNRYDPVYLDDDVAVGAILPDTVEVYEIPDYEYRYVYVNDHPVLIEPDSRRIVYIMR